MALLQLLSITVDYSQKSFNLETSGSRNYATLHDTSKLYSKQS